MGFGQKFFIALDASIIKRQPGGIGADALPVFHLAQIAALGDLFGEINLANGMNGVRREGFFIDNGLWIIGGQACQCASNPSPSEETRPMPVIQTSFS